MALNPLEVISQTFNALKDSYVDTFKYGLLWYLLPAAIIYTLLYTIFPILAQPDVTAEMITGLQSGLVVFSSIATSILGLLYFSYALVRRVKKQHISLSQATQPALRIVGVYLVFLVAILVPALLVAFLFLNSSYVAGALLTIVLLVFAGILMVYWSPVYAEIATGSRVFESLKKSYALVKGSWWRTFAALLLFSLLMGVAVGVVFPLMLILGFVTLVAPVMGQIVLSILSIAFSVALVPISASFMVSLHEQLSEN